MTWSCSFEHLGVLVGDHSPAGADVGRKHPGRVVRGPIERTHRGVGLVSRIAEADVVRRLAAPEVGVQSLGRELVEAIDRMFQSVCRDVDLTCQLGDRVGALDRALLDQRLGQGALLQRIGTRHVAPDIALVEDLPARHRLVRVHRLADLDVRVRLVAEPLSSCRRRRWRRGAAAPIPAMPRPGPE